MRILKEVQVAGQSIRFEFNRYAKQAAGSVMVSSGGTQVLVTACAADKEREGIDFFPLTVDYIEKFYAAGRIPGGFVKRETKPSEFETLTARVIDRPLRPSFPEGYRCETQIVATVLSYEPGIAPAPLALIGASTALMISDIPFNGPVAALQIGKDADGNFVNNPTPEQRVELDLNIAANPGAVLMVEAGANFLSEAEMIDAINFAHDAMKPLFEMQLEVQKEIGKPKRDVKDITPDPRIVEAVDKLTDGGPLKEALTTTDKKKRSQAIRELKETVLEAVAGDEDGELRTKVSAIFENKVYTSMRKLILDDRKRIDGRSFTDIRAIECETDILARAHGSALFQRGETQALGIVTLGSEEDKQRVDNIANQGATKRFMLHYNFPPFSVGEARPLRHPGRREIGHGALAERALTPILPSEDKFGYTIRLVSEVLESNGSSSMATVCAGTMAMLNAGVPLSEPVAGIAMGLVKEGDSYAVLSDILGDEDHLGDMDFKVTGSKRGITALQMDIKIDGLPKEIMVEALNQAKQGREHILEKMDQAINTPGEISEYAPRIFQIKVPSEKIRDLIGPGGKMIKKIVADTGVKVDIEDSGMVKLIAPDATSAEAAKDMIRSVTADPEVGGIYLGKVRRIVDFGAFVEIKPGLEGLLHISQIAPERIEKVTDVLNDGEDVLVKVTEIDRQGRVKLSRKDALGKKPTVQ